MRVDEELKRKRAELLDEADELAFRIKTIKKQVSAIDQDQLVGIARHLRNETAHQSLRNSLVCLSVAIGVFMYAALDVLIQVLEHRLPQLQRGTAQ
jgi:hypothetical protein